VSGYGPDGAPVKKESDPALKFLGGCALVVGALVAIVILVGGLAAWRLVRDETPGRPEETFSLPDDTAYGSFELRPDDPGLQALLQHLKEGAERLRRESGPQSPFAGLRMPRRNSDLAQIFPMRVELADGAAGWAVRVTMSKQVLRLRAALKVMRWFMTRDGRQADSAEVDGVAMTTLRPHGEAIAAFAMVGDRLLVAEKSDRLHANLSSHREAEGARGRPPDETDAYHDAVRRSGELGWGFRLGIEAIADGRHRSVGRETASYVLDADGVLDIAALFDLCDTCSLEILDAAAARTIVAAVAPGVDPAAIVLAEGSPRRTGDRQWRIEATIPDVATKLEEAFAKAMAPPSREPPSATPPPPSPGRTSGPRNGTRAAPPRGGTPTPPR
jgi:hypothetical protein